MSEVDERKPHLRNLHDGKMYELFGEMIVGRLADCDITLDLETGVSRKHACFMVVDQDVFVTDLGSLNGTLVNGVSITGKARLSSGDLIIFDENEYELLIPSRMDKLEVDPDKTIIVRRDRSNSKNHVSSNAHSVENALLEVSSADKAEADQDTTTAEQAKAASESIASADVKVAADEGADVERVPGAWIEQPFVSNSENTIFGSAVAVGKAQAQHVDLESLTTPTIVVKTGENTGAMISLVGEQATWTIGAGDNQHLKLTEEGVSTKHAVIYQKGTKWKVVDQMSTNGTFVNDVKYNIRFMNNGDSLRFGPVECVFVLPAGYVGVKRAGGGSRLFWKIAIALVIVLLAVGGYYAYKLGMLSSAASFFQQILSKLNGLLFSTS